MPPTHRQRLLPWHRETVTGTGYLQTDAEHLAAEHTPVPLPVKKGAAILFNDAPHPVGDAQPLEPRALGHRSALSADRSGPDAAHGRRVPRQEPSTTRRAWRPSRTALVERPVAASPLSPQPTTPSKRDSADNEDLCTGSRPERPVPAPRHDRRREWPNATGRQSASTSRRASSRSERHLADCFMITADELKRLDARSHRDRWNAISMPIRLMTACSTAPWPSSKRSARSTGSRSATRTASTCEGSTYRRSDRRVTVIDGAPPEEELHGHIRDLHGALIGRALLLHGRQDRGAGVGRERRRRHRRGRRADPQRPGTSYFIRAEVSNAGELDRFRTPQEAKTKGLPARGGPQTYRIAAGDVDRRKVQRCTGVR